MECISLLSIVCYEISAFHFFGKATLVINLVY